METLILTTTAAGAVLPRKLQVELSPGAGRLDLSALPPRAPAWSASVAGGWRAACALAGREDLDARLRIAGPAQLEGASAGLPMGLAALAALLERPPPAAFSSGGVTTPEGDLLGGTAAAVKAAAAAGLARQLGRTEPLFLAPPLERVPEVPGIRIACATDLGGAFARADPEGYARIASRHRALRAAVPAEGPAVREAEGWVAFAEAGRILWRRPSAGLASDALAAQHALARRWAFPPA